MAQKSVWWFQIPITSIEENHLGIVNLICQRAPDENEFYYLKVPVQFFLKHLEKFHIVENKISIYLSTRYKRSFVEERGKGNLDFQPFLAETEDRIANKS